MAAGQVHCFCCGRFMRVANNFSWVVRFTYYCKHCDVEETFENGPVVAAIVKLSPSHVSVFTD